MKVCYIFREKERNAHSIEILFDTISEEVQTHGIVIEKWFKPLSNWKSIIAVRKLKADIYHITGDCYFLALFLPWKKTLMTVHDIGMYKNHAKTLKRKLFAFISFVLPFKLLRVSTVISELTKNDLINLLGVKPDKIKIINNPLVLPISLIPKEVNTQKPVILQLGSGDHKNLKGLIEAVKGMDCFLDIVGSPGEKLMAKMDAYGIDYISSKNISNEAIIEKYKNCDLVYFASFSEGFGLPILEAQAMGRAVVTSNMEPMKSVCGKGGLLVDPNDPDEIRSAILKLVNDKSVNNYCIEEGILNVKNYDKGKIAKQYINIYKALMLSTIY